MAVDTAAAGDDVTSDLWNQLAQLVNGGTGFGQPVKLYDFNNSSLFSLTVGNQDTTNGQIARFQYGTVGAATTVVDITKAGLLAKVRDIGGEVFHLDAYAGGTVINTGVNSSDAAWIAAIAAASLVGGGTIQLGPGTYLSPTPAVTWANNLCIRGVPGHTVIKHRDSSNVTPFSAVGVTNFGLRDIIFDGNLANNLAYPYPGSEIVLTGTDIYVIGCTVKDFNIFGIQVGGTRVRVNDNLLYINNGDGAAAASYAALTNLTTDAGYQGYTGIATPGYFGLCRDIEVSGNVVAGLRGPAIFVGGVGVKITNNRVRNCHRSYCLLPDGVTHTGGGVIGPSPTDTLTTPGGQRCRDFLIANNVVMPPPQADVATLGNWATGIEVVIADDGVLADNVIGAEDDTVTPGVMRGMPAYGISIQGSTRIKVVGGSISGCRTAGLNVTTGTSGFGVSDVNFSKNVVAVQLTGTIDNYAIQGCHFSGNTTNYSTSSTGRNFEFTGNVTVDADLMPELRSMLGSARYASELLNDSLGGHGLLIQAGSTLTEYALKILTRRAGANLLSLTGAGTLRIGEAGVPSRITGDMSDAAPANRLLFQTTTTDGTSSVGVIPNGVGTQGGIQVYNNSAPGSGTAGQFLALSTDVRVNSQANGGAQLPLKLMIAGTTRMEMNATGLAFFAATPVAKPTVTGSRGANAALASALTALANLGLITDSSS